MQENEAKTQQANPDAAVVLVNLGSPDELTPRAIRRYLREFLLDRRVIEAPRLIWWLVLHCVILPLRPKKLMHAYGAIWTEEGSPLRQISLEQRAALQAKMDKSHGEGKVKVSLAMTYGKPSMSECFAELQASGIKRVAVQPLFPQYSATSTGAAFDSLARALRTQRALPDLRIQQDYHDAPSYITTLADSVRQHWQEAGRQGHLLLSFHGLPKAYVEAGDPYQQQCQRTAELLAQALQLNTEQWTLAYQSRVGVAEWIKPYTDATLQAWGEAGRVGVDVICPGFSADCLETLEEMAIGNKELFEAAGGQDYRYIEGLNAQNAHIDLIAELADTQMQGWID